MNWFSMLHSATRLITSKFISARQQIKIQVLLTIHPVTRNKRDIHHMSILFDFRVTKYLLQTSKASRGQYAPASLY